MKEQPTAFAIIGHGHIGKRHAAVINGNEGARLLAVCDIDVRTLSGVPDDMAFTDIREMLSAHPGIEVVNICSPNGLHAEHALLALQHDKHVVIEKPMALNTADCDILINEAKKRNKHIFCVMQNRFSPPSAWIKQVVSEGLLGDIYMVQVNCYWNRDERYYTGDTWHGTADLDGGTLFTQFSHFMDTMLWLFGDITDLQAQFADFNHRHLTAFEDSGMVQFKFVRGGIGSWQYSTSVYDRNFESSIRIIGEKGTVCLGGQYMNEVTYCHIEHYIMPHLEPTAAPNNYGAYTGSAANHHFIIQNVLDVLHRGAPIATTAEEGRMVVNAIERIYALRPSSLLRS